MAVSERNLEDRPVSRNGNYKPRSAKAYLDCDVSLETVSDGPQRMLKILIFGRKEWPWGY